jgi:hypothetical protein
MVDDLEPARAALLDAVRGLGEVGLAGQGRAAALVRLHGAVAVRAQADRVLAAAVDAVRAAGGTWQEIGTALGTSRQAAYQRFGRPFDPRTGGPVERTVLDGAPERAIEIFTMLAAGDWEGARADFDPTMAAALPATKLADTWAMVVGTVGAYARPGEPFARRQGDLTVVDVPLAFEAGEMTGRVALRPDGQVAGLFVLDPGVPR